MLLPSGRVRLFLSGPVLNSGRITSVISVNTDARMTFACPIKTSSADTRIEQVKWSPSASTAGGQSSKGRCYSTPASKSIDVPFFYFYWHMSLGRRVPSVLLRSKAQTSR